MTSVLPQATIDRFLEDDPANRGARYFAMRDLLNLPVEDRVWWLLRQRL